MLKTIEENNDEVQRLSQQEDLTGVECPNCKKELQFADNTILTSSPPQRNVVCFGCGHSGRIYVKTHY